MKLKFQLMSAFAALAVLATGCAKEESANQTPDVNGEKGAIRLVINTNVDGKTRAAALNGEEATTAETTVNVAEGLKVAVFALNGVQLYADALTLTETEAGSGIYATDPIDAIELPAGQAYFYVFANDADDDITLPTPGQEMQPWMETEFDITYAAGKPAIATDNAFLLGTLWKDAVVVPAGGTVAEPETVELSIGRLASKVKVTAVAQGTSSMAGTFSDPNYRMGTLALGMSHAGVYEGTTLPYTAGVLVTSSKHDAAFELNEGDADFNTVDFQQYGEWDAVTATLTDDFFYAIENTTARTGASLQQFYGNTTYIQIETKYTPLNNEIYSVTGTTAEDWALVAGTDADPYTGGTFVSVYKGNERLLMAAAPTAEQMTALGLTEGGIYTNGLNYHKFAVQDAAETDAVMKNRVLRNTYYEYAITKIDDLGSWTSEVDPTEPVEENTMIELEIKVADWDKVANPNIEL